MEKIIGTLLALAALVALSYWIGFSNEHTITVTAYGIEKITNTYGNKDGFSTDVYYLLSTDHGTYRIGIDGIYAHPEYALRFRIPRTEIPGVFALMEAEDTPTCELRIKKPNVGVREIEIITDEANAGYFRTALGGA